MAQRDLADPNWRHPYEDEEEDASDIEELIGRAIREFGRKAIRLISGILDELPDSPEKWGIAFAVGANCCAGRSMSEVAAMLGVTRALISYRAKDFCRRYELPPSPYMKSKR